MDDEMWHLTDDFTKLPSRDVLKNVIRDDKKNYNRAESELSGDLQLLNRAIVLYIEALQAGLKNVEKWKSNNSNRAAMAMLKSTLNYILLARHGILLGYYPEVRDLLRSCYERISRCHLFFYKERFASKFLSGKTIWQVDVDRELSKLEEDPVKREELYTGFRQYYGSLSGVVHPNLESFIGRYGDKNGLGERVGLGIVLGGIMSASLGRVAIISVLQTVLSALTILGRILHDASGEWDKEMQRIRERCEGMVDEFLSDDQP